MGNKKNKRGSLPGPTTPTTKTELIERTPENDYGVLSDPEEGTELNEKNQADNHGLPYSQANPQQSPILNDSNSVPISVPQSADNETHSPQQKQSSPQLSIPPTQSPTQSPTQQPSPRSTLSLSPPLPQQGQSPPSPTLTLSGRLTPSLPPPSPGTKSLKALQLKLTSDKNYTKKITLHTFFSYVVLAIEIVRASSPSIARISIDNVEKLVTYLIDHHTANEDIEKYLRTLIHMGVIRNLIAAVVEFNTDQADALDKLLSAEQMEMELITLKDAATAASSGATAHDDDDNRSHQNAPTSPTPQMSQTSQSQSRPNRFFAFLKCLFCCGRLTPGEAASSEVRVAEVS